MRVIAGSARGTLLRVPGEGTRPTSDRVREALFSILGTQIGGARVLDLFAGSGALGIEALSRGARHATFVDQRQDACSAIAANLAKSGLAASATVRGTDVFRFLRQVASGPDVRFDLVFADPPYGTGADEGSLAREVLAWPGWAGIIAPEAILVLESRRDGTKYVGPFWEESDRRRYGDTLLTFFVPTPA